MDRGDSLSRARDTKITALTARVLVASLLAFNLLFPLDRGFPALPLMGHPLNSAIAATLGVLGILLIQSRGRILLYLCEPYSIVQSAYCVVLVLSALVAPSPPVALHASLLYYCTFVLNYAILRYVTRKYGVRWISVCVVCVGLLAAAVSIAQGLLGLSIPIYDEWYRRYSGAAAEDYSLATVRASGTMSNPILYGLLMVLVIPYAFDLKHTIRRTLALFVVVLAAGLSGSRTVLVGALFGIGAVVVYRWRTLWVLPFAAIGLIVLAMSLGGIPAAGEDSRIDFLLQRAGLRPETNEAVSSAAFGINLRREVLAEGLREMADEWGGLTWIVGRGYFSATSVGQRVLPWYTTVDNVYMTVLYERGLLGLALFVGAGLTFLSRTRHAATATLHWYAPLVLALAGFSFSWDAYSTFNILAVGSMTIAMWHEERARRYLSASTSMPTA